MSEGQSQYTFENLTQSGLFRLYAAEDKNVTLSLNVFGGNTSLAVSTGAGGKPHNIGIPRKLCNTIALLLKRMGSDIKECRNPIPFRKFEENDGKKAMVERNNVAFGIDDKSVFYIDVAADFNNDGRMQKWRFPVKNDARFDFSETVLNERDLIVANIATIMEAFTLSGFAERITSFRRPKQQGGGNWGNKGGSSGGGNWNNNRGSGNSGNYGGGNSGGGQRSGGTFGGGAVVEDDIDL